MSLLRDDERDLIKEVSMREILKVSTFLFVGLVILAGCSSYDEHIDEGNKFAELKLYKEATIEFNKAIDKDRDRGDAYYHWAKMGLDIEDYDSALSSFNTSISRFTEAIQHNPDDAELYNKRGLTYLGRGDTHFERGFSAVKRIDGEQLSAALEASTLDRESAIADFTRAIELSPNHPRFYNNRGLASLYTRDGDAIADYTQAIQLDPSYAEAYVNRGGAYGLSLDYGKALADYAEAIRLDPDYIEIYSWRVESYTRLGEYDKALMDVEKMRTLGADAERLKQLRRYIEANRNSNR